METPPSPNGEMGDQPNGRNSGAKRAWAKPTIKSSDGVTLFESGEQDHPNMETTVYFPAGQEPRDPQVPQDS